MNSNSPLLLLFRRTTVTMGRSPAHPTVYDAIAKIVHPDDDGDGNDGDDGNPVFVA